MPYVLACCNKVTNDRLGSAPRENTIPVFGAFVHSLTYILVCDCSSECVTAFARPIDLRVKKKKRSLKKDMSNYLERVSLVYCSNSRKEGKNRLFSRSKDVSQLKRCSHSHMFERQICNPQLNNLIFCGPLSEPVGFTLYT